MDDNCELVSFDASDFLDNDELIAEYINSVLQENDTELLLAALNQVARAKGMANIAAAAGLGRESLYKALREGAKPQFATILKVLGSMGFSLSVAAAQSTKAPS